jgi:hypothetical protein
MVSTKSLRPQSYLPHERSELFTRSDGARSSLAVVAAANPAATGRTATIVARTPPGRPAAAAARALRARLIHDEVPVTEHAAVQLLDRARGLLGRGHLHEAEPFRPTGELVRHDADRLHGPGLLKELAEVLLRSLVGQVPYEELGGHSVTSDFGENNKAPGEARLSEGR